MLLRLLEVLPREQDRDGAQQGRDDALPGPGDSQPGATPPRDKAYGEAEKLAKKWVAGVSAAISVGTKEDKDLVEPLRAFLTNRYNHLMAIMDLDVATSQLMLATGDESITDF